MPSLFNEVLHTIRFLVGKAVEVTADLLRTAIYHFGQLDDYGQFAISLTLVVLVFIGFRSFFDASR